MDNIIIDCLAFTWGLMVGLFVIPYLLGFWKFNPKPNWLK